jgi:glycine cleavage system H protein
MSDNLYSEDHEWINVDGDTGTVGVSNFAQEQLGDVVFVDLPQVGAEVSKGDEVAVVESVKAASEIYTPVSGEITAVNETLNEAPETVNADAENGGWLYKIKLADEGELDGLMDADAYAAFAKE